MLKHRDEGGYPREMDGRTCSCKIKENTNVNVSGILFESRMYI